MIDVFYNEYNEYEAEDYNELIIDKATIILKVYLTIVRLWINT